MPVLLQVHRLAWRELDEASERYEGHVNGGGRFVDASESSIALIAAHPRVGRVVHRTRRGLEVRQFRVRPFPYAVVYVFVEPATIVVYAIAHGKRRPKYWADRLRRH